MSELSKGVVDAAQAEGILTELRQTFDRLDYQAVKKSSPFCGLRVALFVLVLGVRGLLAGRFACASCTLATIATGCGMILLRRWVREMCFSSPADQGRLHIY